MTEVKSETIAEQAEKYSQDLEFSASSALSGEQHEYSQLDAFSQSSELHKEGSETSSEVTSETTSENSPPMTDEDAISIAGMGVEQVAKYVSENLEAPVVISENHKEEISVKGAALVKKYLPSGEMPTWLLAFKAEIEFGLAVGACAFSVYKQNQVYQQSLIEGEKVADNGS